jgi:hypothetical protein
MTSIKPTHKALDAYYRTLQAYTDQQVRHEGALETAFQQLLGETARSRGWMLVPKLPIRLWSEPNATFLPLDERLGVAILDRRIHPLDRESSSGSRFSLGRTGLARTESGIIDRARPCR